MWKMEKTYIPEEDSKHEREGREQIGNCNSKSGRTRFNRSDVEILVQRCPAKIYI